MKEIFFYIHKGLLGCDERVIEIKNIDCFYIAPSQYSDFEFQIYVKTWFGHLPLYFRTEQSKEIQAAFNKLYNALVEVNPNFKIYNSHCINFENVRGLQRIKSVNNPRVKLSFGIGSIEFSNTSEEQIEQIKNDIQQARTSNLTQGE